MRGIDDRDAPAENDEVVLSRVSRVVAYWGERGGVGEGTEEVDGFAVVEMYWYECVRGAIEGRTGV